MWSNGRDTEHLIWLNARSSLLFIPAKIIPEGYEYRWIRFSSKNNIDYENIINSLRDGYIPVLAEKHPEIVERLNNPALLESYPPIDPYRSRNTDNTDRFSGVESYPPIDRQSINTEKFLIVNGLILCERPLDKKGL